MENLRQELITIRDNLNSTKVYFEGELAIKRNYVNAFFKLLHDFRPQLVSVELYGLTKEINDLVVNVLTNVIAGNEKGLYIGQTTHNAGTDESKYHEILGWSYGGGGELDHQYDRTGKGLPGTDFKLTQDCQLTVRNIETNEECVFSLRAGMTIDAKTCKYLEDTYEGTKLVLGAKTRVANNTDGSWGHFGNYLAIDVFTLNKYYFAINMPGFKPTLYEILNFKPEGFPPLVALSINALDNILEVKYLN